MKPLLDTHAFLWFAAGDSRLSRRARRKMEASDVELLVAQTRSEKCSTVTRARVFRKYGIDVVW